MGRRRYMLSKIRYVFHTIEGSDRSRLRRLSLAGLFVPVIDVFSISMLLPILSRMTDAESSDKVLLQVLGIGFLLLLKTGFDLLLARMDNSFRYDSVQKLSVKMYELSQKESLPEHKKRTQGQNLARIRRDAAASVGILLYAKSLLTAILTALGYAVVLVWSMKLIGAVSLGCVAVVFAVLYLLNRIRIGDYSERVRALEIQTNEMIYNAFGAYKEVKVDRNKDVLRKQYDGVSNKLAAEEKRFAMFSQMITLLTADILQAAVFFVLAILLVLRIDITSQLSAIIVFITVLVKFLPLSSGILHNLIGIRFAEANYARFHEAYEAYTVLKAEEALREKIPVRYPTLQKGIRVEGLTFAYEENEPPVIENGSIEIPHGKAVAVIGSSGNGKTTFLDLLLGLLKPQAGEIWYDDVDITKTEDVNGRYAVELGALISYIPQVVVLSGYTIRDNVSFMTPGEADEARIVECLKDASFYEDVMAMPDGLDTVIGSNGTRLSGGQRQRLALARALYKDFELLVLDEATASLDMETEAAILQSIREKKAGKTILMVTHHQSLAEACDIVYRLENRRFERIRE